jgi:aminoglycoside 3-N-acetyltransferase
MKPQATKSKILYVRAGLKHFVHAIDEAGGVLEFLRQYWEFEEIFVPFFRRIRPFWEKPPKVYVTNSGVLGKLVNGVKNSVRSNHPTHSFVGVGARVSDIFRSHNQNKSCFYPINEFAEKHDFSMLLLGCVEESPGFSSVHATQCELGLTKKHIVRILLRWDYEINGIAHSNMAKETPGCSLSFGKFYPEYEKEGNLIGGEILRSKYLFVPSARKAMEIERKILLKNPRFVDCGSHLCATCRFRLY